MTTSTTSPLAAATVVAIHDRLKKSVLSPAVALNSEGAYDNGTGQRTYVENPYSTINLSRINKTPTSVKDAVGLVDPAPAEYLLDDVAFAAKLSKTKDPTFKAVATKSQADRAKLWLDSAKSVAERVALPGFCNLFAMVTVVLLVADDSPLTADVPVEWVGSGSGFGGHMTVVVNREPDSDIARPDTWGANYLVVDYWYGLQQKAGPIFLPRKATDIARKEAGALDQHEVYRLFFDDQGTAKSFGAFRPRSYRPLKVKLKTDGTF